MLEVRQRNLRLKAFWNRLSIRALSSQITSNMLSFISSPSMVVALWAHLLIEH